MYIQPYMRYMLNNLIFYLDQLIKAWSFFKLNFMLDTILERILKAYSTQISWINPLNISLIILALAIIIDPIGTCNGSCSVTYWFSSLPFSKKRFNHKSLPTSKKEKLEKLNITLTLYSPRNLNLYTMSSFHSRT